MNHRLVKLTPQQAVLACLTLVVAADGAPSDEEQQIVARLLAATPALGTDKEDTQNLGLELALDILSASEGVETLLELAAQALTPGAQALAYALAADFVLLNGQLAPEEMRVLDLLAETFALNRLTRAAIDSAAHIRLSTTL